MSRRWAIVLAVLSLVAVGCKTTGGGGGTDPTEPPPTPVRGLPSSMVALGDSITAAFGSCLAPTSCPRNSWSTGDGTQVNSHYRRIVRANPAMADHARNLAVPGALVADLQGQATAAARQRADYVTILIGANDACRGEMTAVADFRAKLDQALATLKQAMPQARVLMVSIPNVYRVWEIGHTNRVATGVWKSGICPNLLTNATSNAAADVARRTAFRDRIGNFNGQIADACADYGSRCRHDRIDGFAFELNMLSAIDFFHPNAAGQSALAEETYPGTFTW
jgi:lysophospholipase L1-like esterase